MKKRIVYGSLLTAGMLSVLVADYLWQRDFLVALVIALLSALAYVEFATILARRRIVINPITGSIYSILVVLATMIAARGDVGGEFLPGALLVIATFVGLACARMADGERALLTIAGELLGLVYIPLAMGSLLALRALGTEGSGTVLIFTTVVIIKGGDIAAYFAGTLLGKHKLAPRLSPGKTIEGLLAQILTGILLGFVVLACVCRVLPGGAAALFGCLVSVAGCAGDLVESKIKRICGVKDSGALVPQFGGVLDMIDSILLGAPTAWALVTLFGQVGIFGA